MHYGQMSRITKAKALLTPRGPSLSYLYLDVFYLLLELFIIRPMFVAFVVAGVLAVVLVCAVALVS